MIKTFKSAMNENSKLTMHLREENSSELLNAYALAIKYLNQRPKSCEFSNHLDFQKLHLNTLG